MILLPGEQRALLRIERSLRRDPGLVSALDAFSRPRCSGGAPGREGLSPWHPVLWRAVPAGLVAAVLALVALAVVLALGAIRPARPSCRAALPVACLSSAGGTAPARAHRPPKTGAGVTHGHGTPPGGSPLHGIATARDRAGSGR